MSADDGVTLVHNGQEYQVMWWQGDSDNKRVVKSEKLFMDAVKAAQEEASGCEYGLSIAPGAFIAAAAEDAAKAKSLRDRAEAMHREGKVHLHDKAAGLHMAADLLESGEL